MENIGKDFIKGNLKISAVAEITWQAKAGELTVVHGKSGSGKSTLLMMIGGMMKPTCGTISVDQNDIYKLSRSKRNYYRREKVGFIFQKFLLLPYFTVYENVALTLTGRSSSDRHNQALAMIERFDLTPRLHHLPSELSIGQQQRVAMARALAKDPQIILADEPTGNLDDENSTIVINYLREAAATGKTVIAATHDIRLLEQADNRLKLQDGYAAN